MKKGKVVQDEDKLMIAVPGFAHARESLMQINYTAAKMKEGDPNNREEAGSPTLHRRARAPSQFSEIKASEIIANPDALKR